MWPKFGRPDPPAYLDTGECSVASEALDEIFQRLDAQSVAREVQVSQGCVVLQAQGQGAAPVKPHAVPGQVECAQ